MRPLRFGELETWGWSNLGLHSHGNHVYTGHVFPLNASPDGELITTRPRSPLLIRSEFVRDLPCSKLRPI